MSKLLYEKINFFFFTIGVGTRNVWYFYLEYLYFLTNLLPVYSHIIQFMAVCKKTNKRMVNGTKVV